MRHALFAILGVWAAAQGAWAWDGDLKDFLPMGVYDGTGHWTAPDGRVGNYEVQTRVRTAMLVTRYRMRDENDAVLEVTDVFQFYSDNTEVGRFKIYAQGKNVGLAECRLNHCELAFNANDKLNQEIVQASSNGRELVRTGCIVDTGVCWEEKLTRHEP